jgi:ketosteroid isomerase-like protein
MTPRSTHLTNDTSEIIRVMRAYHAAMVAAHVADLDKLVAQDHVLVHITGMTQPKHEWFDVIRSGKFDYHSIEIDEMSLVVNVTGDAAVLNGRGIFTATIDGMKKPWRLQFALRYARTGGQWLIMHARYICG